MPGFLDTVQEFYSTTNLYEVLGVNKTANDKELKRAYHRLSLKVHPDRVEQEEVAEATRKFQVFLSILTDTCYHKVRCALGTRQDIQYSV